MRRVSKSSPFAATYICAPSLLLAAALILVSPLPAAAQQPAAPATQMQTPSPNAHRLTLQEALALADRQNLDLVAARLQRAVSLAGVTIAGERPNPSVTFNATRDHPHETLAFDQPLELNGKRGTRMEEARQEAVLTDLDITALQREIRHEVRDAFFAVALAKAFADQQGQLVELAQRLRGIAQDRFNAGDVPQIEVMQADLELSRAQADQQVAQKESAVALTRLSTLLNEPAGTRWELATPLEGPLPTLALPDLITRASDANPELRHLEQEITVEQSKQKMYRAEKFPEISVELGGVFNAPGEYHGGVSGGATVGIPIFSRYQGELAQSSATQTLVRAELQARQRSVAGEVEAAYNEVLAKLTEVDLYNRTVIPAGRKLEDLAEQSYRAGKANILSVLDAQRSVQENERDYLQSLFDLQQAFAELEDTVGVSLD
jgi:outer membrane protein, heavy metal efflux system